MKIKSYLYRLPSYLPPININRIDTIAIHHTGNNNSIDTNTDHHMDSNGWSWLGYNYYIMNGEILKVRGYKNQGAGVRHHNHHTISIAVEGNYDKEIPSQDNLDALQYLVSYLKTELPNIKVVDGHKRWNDTSCPGRLFPIRTIKLEPLKEETPKPVDNVDNVDKLEQKVKDLDSKVTRILRYLDGQGVRIR